ncbi:MAG: ABC transporter permease [Candidatus Bathyarchaeota archaeon]|nr:ABC transporter permease [Candidatus Bathyarchaeota archaeon]
MSVETEIFEIVVRSIVISGSATLLAVLWGLPVGILVGLKSFRAKSVVKGFFNTFMGMPTVSLGLFLYMLFSRSGPLGFLRFLYTPSAIIVGQAVLVTPIVISLVTNTVESVDPEIRDLARTLGASETQASIAVLKESTNGVVLSIVTSFNRAIAELGVAFMLGGNIRGLTRVLTTSIAFEATKAEELFLAIALTVVLLVIVFTLNTVVNLIQRRGAGSR